MLESLRKKKETEMQVKMLENRIRRLKDEETLLKSKETTQRRQIEQILRIRRQAQAEKEAQIKRKEEIMREIEEKKAKISKVKQVIHVGIVRSVRRKQYEIQRVVNELREERKLRSLQIHENKEKEVAQNQIIAKQCQSQVPASPYRQLDERRKKLLREQRH
jgi:chromosome segregation ATPase